MFSTSWQNKYTTGLSCVILVLCTSYRAVAQMDILEDPCFWGFDTSAGIHPIDTTAVSVASYPLIWDGTEWATSPAVLWNGGDLFPPPPCPGRNIAGLFGIPTIGNPNYSVTAKTKKLLRQGVEYEITLTYCVVDSSINGGPFRFEVVAYEPAKSFYHYLYSTSFTTNYDWHTDTRTFKLPPGVDSISYLRFRSDIMVITAGLLLGDYCTLGTDTGLCDNESLILSPGEGSDYLWQDGSTNSTFIVTTPGKYYVTYKNEANCSDTINVYHADLSSIDMDNDTTLCPGDSYRLQPELELADSWYWQDGSVSPTYLVTKPGTYTLTAANKCGERSKSVNFDYYQLPKLDQVLCENQSVNLDATSVDAISYRWQDGSESPLLEVTDPGNYFVDVTWNCGTRRKEKVVEPVNCSCLIHVPNSFTPNNDGLNDYFAPEIYCDLDSYVFTIYSRWGDVVYKTNNPLAKWDASSIHSASGIYIWQIDYSYYDELSNKKKSDKRIGRVSVLR